MEGWKANEDLDPQPDNALPARSSWWGLIYIAVCIVTAQTSEDEDGRPPRYPTYEECMYWENDHEYCEHLLPPTYTPTATATHTHTHTPTATATHAHTPTATADSYTDTHANSCSYTDHHSYAYTCPYGDAYSHSHSYTHPHRHAHAYAYA